MNKTALSVIVAMAAATTAPALAQNPLTTDRNEQVRVRMIHAVPNAPGATVSIGGTELFSDVAFKQITSYSAMPEQEDRKVLIKLADGKQLQTTDEFDLDDGDEAYTVLVTPDKSGPNPKVIILEDDDDRPDGDDANEADLNVVNASSQHDSITVHMDDKELVDGVDYGDSEDEDVRAGSYSLRVTTDSGGSETDIATQQVSLEGAQSYTLVVFGDNDVKLVNDMSPDQPVSGGAATSPGAATTSPSASSPSATPAATPGNTQTGTMMSTMPVTNPGL